MAAAFALSGCAPYRPPAVFDPTPRTELAPGMVMSSVKVASTTRLSVVHADLPSDFPGLSTKEREAAFGVDFKFTVDETGSVRNIEFIQASAPSLEQEYRTFIQRWKFKPPTQNGVATPMQRQFRITHSPKGPDTAATEVDPANGIEYHGTSIASSNLRSQIMASYEVLFRPMTGCQKIDRVERQSLGAFKPVRFNESRVAVEGEMQERWLARGCGKAFIAYVWFAFTQDGMTNHALSTSPERVRAIVRPPALPSNELRPAPGAVKSI